MNSYDENEKSSYLEYSHVNNCYCWEMSQKRPVNGFEFEFLNLMKDLQKTLMKKGMKDIFLKLMLNILKYYTAFMMIYYFYLKE